MFTIDVQIHCDNDKCPHEASAKAKLTVTITELKGWRGLVDAVVLPVELGTPELPEGWVYAEGKTYCSTICKYNVAS